MPTVVLKSTERALLSALCYAASEYETRGIAPLKVLLEEATIEELECYLLLAQLFDDDEGPTKTVMQLNW